MKYTPEQIEKMRDILVDQAADSMREGHFNLESIAGDGFIGYYLRDDDRVIEEFESQYDADEAMEVL